MERTIRATSEMCILCFDILIAKLKNKVTDPILDKFYSTEAQTNVNCPLFVTWKIGEDLDLRGCIGTFDQSSKIGELLSRYALISALNDSRFSPISLREVQHLTVCVSLLTNFTPILNPLDWEIGKHGIEIELRQGNRNYTGTYLPEVAEEQNWDQPTTLVYLFKKAGLKPSNPNRPPLEIVNEFRDSLKVTTYESSKFSLSYQEYTKLVNIRED